MIFKDLLNFFKKYGFVIFEILCSLILAYFFNIHGSNLHPVISTFAGLAAPLIIFTPINIFNLISKSNHYGEQLIEMHREIEDMKKLINENITLVSTSVGYEEQNKIFLSGKNEMLSEIIGLEAKQFRKQITTARERSLYQYSYTPNVELFKNVCNKLFSMFDKPNSKKYFYATARCDQQSVNWFFDYTQISNVFLEQLYNKIQNNQIYPFNRLFIYDELFELNMPLMRFLILLHKNSKHLLGAKVFDFKFIAYTKFKALVESMTDEVGVWGDQCLFIQRDKPENCGYLFNKQDINNHKEQFSQVWRKATTWDKIEGSLNYEHKIDDNDTALSRSIKVILAEMEGIEPSGEFHSVDDHKLRNDIIEESKVSVNELNMGHIVMIQGFVRGIQKLSNYSSHA